MPFQSTAQQRWAFATNQPFAEDWAKQTDFAALPKRKRKRKKEVTLKHGKHNQATHGRRGPAGRAGQQAYQQARSSGLSVAEARSAGRNATQATRQAIRERDRQRKAEGLQKRAEILRNLASKAGTEKKRASLLARADNLDARALGQPVPNKRQPRTPAPVQPAAPAQPRPVPPAGRRTREDYEQAARAAVPKAQAAVDKAQQRYDSLVQRGAPQAQIDRARVALQTAQTRAQTANQAARQFEQSAAPARQSVATARNQWGTDPAEFYARARSETAASQGAGYTVDIRPTGGGVYRFGANGLERILPDGSSRKPTAAEARALDAEITKGQVSAERVPFGGTQARAAAPIESLVQASPTAQAPIVRSSRVNEAERAAASGDRTAIRDVLRRASEARDRGDISEDEYTSISMAATAGLNRPQPAPAQPQSAPAQPRQAPARAPRPVTAADARRAIPVAPIEADGMPSSRSVQSEGVAAVYKRPDGSTGLGNVVRGSDGKYYGYAGDSVFPVTNVNPARLSDQQKRNFGSGRDAYDLAAQATGREAPPAPPDRPAAPAPVKPAPTPQQRQRVQLPETYQEQVLARQQATPAQRRAMQREFDRQTRQREAAQAFNSAQTDRMQAESDLRKAQARLQRAQAKITGTPTPAQQRAFNNAEYEVFSRQRELAAARQAEAEAQRQMALAVQGKEARSLFRVLKSADGASRWVAISSSAYRDRDGEIVSTKALSEDVQMSDAVGDYGPLRFWHIPGFDIGRCDFRAMVGPGGRFLLESGTFHSEAIAQKVAKHADSLGMTIGFYHSPNEPDRSGVFNHIRTFERSIAPRDRVSNLFTSLTVKGKEMMTEEKRKEALRLLGPDILALFEGEIEQRDKTAQAQRIAHKEFEPAEEIEINGVTYTLKHAMKAESGMSGGSEDDGEDMGDGEDEGDGENYVGDMTTGDLKMLLREALNESMMEMTGKMSELDAQLKGMGYERKKEASAVASTQTEVADLRAQLATLSARLKELEGDAPAYVRPTARAENVVTTKEVAPSDPYAGARNMIAEWGI